MSLLKVEEYTTAVRIVSTILCILGTGSNLLVVALCMKASTEDKRSFILLLKIASLSNAFNSFAGWMVLSSWEIFRVEVLVSGYGIVMPYGLANYAGARFTNILDCFAILVDTYVPLLVCVMMLIRTLIMFNFRIGKPTILFLTSIVVMLAAPEFYTEFVAYRPIESVNITGDLLNESKLFSSYASQFDPLTLLLWKVYNWVPVPTFVICIVLRTIMQWKLRQYSENISQLTKKVHAGFMNFLTLDACVVLFYFFASQYNVFDYFSFSTFHYPMLTIPTIIQGFALLYFVPYLRKTLLKMIGRGNESLPSTLVHPR